ncbi:MAG: hypothetical protein DRJ40_09360 [Thermoprotei archaeon]|nr:MAG: hypothetical protein DRJ40_09360 [Thermoprotei archaeon]
MRVVLDRRDVLYAIFVLARETRGREVTLTTKRVRSVLSRFYPHIMRYISSQQIGFILSYLAHFGVLRIIRWRNNKPIYEVNPKIIAIARASSTFEEFLDAINDFIARRCIANE